MTTGLGEDEGTLLAALKAGDEAAFIELVEAWGPSMLRLARTHVATQTIAEEVVQEAWVGILRGIDRFEGRSSVKTWAFRIVANNAKTRGVRESRTVPFSSTSGDDDGPTVDPDRFRGADDRWPGHWARAPEPWPEDGLAARETRDAALAAIAALPPRQREIVTLRDIEGFTSDEACNALDISETNQRVLLHRARSKVRQALEEHLEP
jgi:RNA polymerase sigma-70 factor (ECF subfamily)